MEPVQVEKGPDALIMDINPWRKRYPFCVVWTPIPVVTWLFPFVGHMGIATSKGVIRDFAASFYVSEDDMGFGWPTRYWQLDPRRVPGGVEAWDRAVKDASDEYKTHSHNLLCDNCHSHVALALNKMQYDELTTYNMVNLAYSIMFKGRYLGITGFLKQWIPFFILLIIIIVVSYML